MESAGEGTLAAAAPTADAIVVLSCGLLVAPGSAAMSEWRGANHSFGDLGVIAYPVDFQVSDDCRFGFSSLLPGAYAVRLNEQPLRETLARTVYRPTEA